MATSYTNSSSRRKLALIIGNGNYQSNNKLVCPTSNAEDLTKVLQSIHFSIKTACNVSREEMATKIKDFSETIRDGDLVVFYFSGHVYQVDDQKYLIPKNDVNIQEDDDFEDLTISFERTVKRFVAKNPSYVTIFILDNCSPYELMKEQTNRCTYSDRHLDEYICVFF